MAHLSQVSEKEGKSALIIINRYLICATDKQCKKF